MKVVKRVYADVDKAVAGGEDVGQAQLGTCRRWGCPTVVTGIIA